MVRTQIQLTEQQARSLSLRVQAHERWPSLAEVIRRYVAKGLADEAPDRTGKRDLSAKHDRYLDEAFKSGVDDAFVFDQHLDLEGFTSVL